MQKSTVESKILLLTYQALNGQAALYPKEVRVPCYLTEQADLLTYGSQSVHKQKGEAEASAVRLLSGGTII